MKVRCALFLLLALAGCKDLPYAEADVCGNAVIEKPREDCDSFNADSGVPGSVCRPKGVVGECHWDCRVNVDGKRGTCPTGWGCAPDGLCHEAVEDAYDVRRLSSDLSSWLSTADFDGDGRTDLISSEPADQVQQARFRLHYFDSEAELEETRTFPRITSRPVVYQPFDQAQSDLVFTNFRVGMLPGRVDRGWVPEAFSSYVVPSPGLRVVSLLDELVLGATLLATFTTLDGKAGVFVPASDASGLVLAKSLARPLQDLTSDPVSVDLITDADSPCKEVVYAFRGEPALHVLDLCQLGSLPPEPDLKFRAPPRELLVRLPDGLGVDAGPVVTDLDGDGLMDLLLGSGGLTYVARGDGHTLTDATGPMQLRTLEKDESFDLPMPLAAGDVSGDDAADFVLPGGVLASHRSLVDGAVRYSASYSNNEQPWTMAQVVDVNGNDLLDVVAASPEVPGVTLLNSTGGFYQVAARLPTRGNVRLLTTGDFDGDLIQDLAFLEAGARQQSADGIAIAFGSRDQLPLTSTRIAEVRGAEQLGHTRDVGLDSLFMAATQRSGDVLNSSLTLWDGSPDRLPFAPYTLVTFSTDGDLDNTPALALAVGGFTKPHVSDVVAFGGLQMPGVKGPAPGYTLWFVPEITGDKQPPRKLELEQPADVRPIVSRDGRYRLSLAVLAVDLDADGLDEVVALMPSGVADCSLVSYGIDIAHGRANLKGQLTLGEPCQTPELGAWDKDEDGIVDALVALTGDPSIAPRRLWLLSDIGQGLEDATRHPAEAPGEDVRGFAIMPARAGAKVAVVTDVGLSVVTTGADSRRLDDWRAVHDFTDARSVAVMDPDQDGLDDLVVADAEGLWLLTPELK